MTPGQLIGPYGPLICYCCARPAQIHAPDGRPLCGSCAHKHADMPMKHVLAEIREASMRGPQA